jgi:hypothetical protein
VIVTELEEATELVRTVNVALVAPRGTVTLEGTVATAVLLLESDTSAPPVGAGPVSVTVPVDECPPVTVVGFSESEASETAEEAGAASKSRTAGLGSLSETATNFEGEIM